MALSIFLEFIVLSTGGVKVAVGLGAMISFDYSSVKNVYFESSLSSLYRLTSKLIY